MKPIRLILGILLACLGVLRAAERPNLIWLMADDLGYGELGCYGQKVIATPNLDRMAREGMRFTHFYAGATVCAPSRSVLMTGQHHGHTRVRGNAGPGNPAAQALRPDDFTVANLLQQSGYKTALIGKWGLGDVGAAESGLPRRHGFDHFFGYLNQRHAHNHFPDFLWLNEERLALPNVVTPVGGDGAGYATRAVQFADDLFTDEALKFVAKHQDRPFFLYWSLVTPHANNERARELKDGAHVPDYGPYAKEDWPPPDKGHASMITRLDSYVGRLLEQLRRLHLEEDTLVIFTSDNGPHNEGGHTPKLFNPSGPLRGMKRDLYEGGIRVPTIAWWPGTIEAGRVRDAPWWHADLLPTAGELAGAELPSPLPKLDGVSIVPLLKGTGDLPADRVFYWEFYEQGGKRAVRKGKWKLVQPRLAAEKVVSELYDLSKDLGESHNIAAEHPDVVKELEAIIEREHEDHGNWPVPGR